MASPNKSELLADLNRQPAAKHEIIVSWKYFDSPETIQRKSTETSMGVT